MTEDFRLPFLEQHPELAHDLLEIVAVGIDNEVPHDELRKRFEARLGERSTDDAFRSDAGLQLLFEVSRRHQYRLITIALLFDSAVRRLNAVPPAGTTGCEGEPEHKRWLTRVARDNGNRSAQLRLQLAEKLIRELGHLHAELHEEEQKLVDPSEVLVAAALSDSTATFQLQRLLRG